jgi:transposase
MYYIGLDVHKKTISYCVKDASGQVHQEGKVGETCWELDDWMQTLPQPWTVAVEATIFTGWIYDHLLPHAQQVKVAHPLMLRAIAAAKKKNDRIDAGKIAECLRFRVPPFGCGDHAFAQGQAPSPVAFRAVNERAFFKSAANSFEFDSVRTQ